MATCKQCGKAFQYDDEVGYAPDICGSLCDGVLSQQPKIEKLRAALLLCRDYADKAMAIDPNDPLAITVEAIAEGRMGPLAADAAGGKR